MRTKMLLPTGILVSVLFGCASQQQADNQPPSITSTAVTTGQANSLYNYDVDAQDPDVGDTLSYALTVIPSGMVINQNTGLITWTPSAAGNFDATVQVSDDKRGSATNLPLDRAQSRRCYRRVPCASEELNVDRRARLPRWVGAAAYRIHSRHEPGRAHAGDETVSRVQVPYPDLLLFYRMGDFYELFFEDARKAARLLDIALTTRGPARGAPL